MKILISSLEDEKLKMETNVKELNYKPADNSFWMRLVMGDDWLQRVSSSFEFSPKIVRYSENICFIACEKNDECKILFDWLVEAEKQVDKGFKTMRG